MIDKDFQLFILRQAASAYPGHALAAWDTLMEAARGETTRERRTYVCAHLKALENFGYLEDVCFQRGVDGFISCNQAFSITEQGLLEIGVDMLHPDPYRELRDALFEQAQTLRELSESQKITLKKVLLQLTRGTLERLRDKGLDALLSLILP